MARATPDDKPINRFLVLASVCIAVAALALAREVLVPIALAILLSFLLAPLVRLLERLRLPRVVAVVLSVLVAFALVGGVGFVVYRQFVDVAEHAQGYADNVKTKVEGMQGQGGILNWFSHAKAETAKLLKLPASQPSTAPTTATAAAAGGPPSPGLGPGVSPAAVQRVEVVNQQRETSPLSTAESVLSEVMGRAGVAFIVVVFTIFMLIQREELRDRVIRLVGRDRLTTTTEALDDAGNRVSSYLLFQSIINAAVGLFVAGLLWLEGRIAGTPFPSPAVWGLLSGLMRFIPYVGIWISAAFPVLLSVAVFASFKWTFITVGVYVVAELVTANAIEPLLFGSSTGIGSLAVLVAAAFWAWLWGPVGLLLSTPLTVCLVVMGKYVPALNFLSVLLSDEPALPPPDRVYQRLLATDSEEAEDLLHEYAGQMPLEQLYDEVVLPALTMVESETARGGLTVERRAAIRQSVLDITAELGEAAKAEAATKAKAALADDANRQTRVEHAETTAAAKGKGGVSTAPTDPGRVHLPDGCVLNVLCLPAHDMTDQVAATLFGQLLGLRGYCVTVLSTEQLASEMVAAVDSAKPDAVVISSLPPAAVAHARYLCKRLEGDKSAAELLIGLWNYKGDVQRARQRIACGDGVRLADSLRAGIAQVHEVLQPKLAKAATAAAADRPPRTGDSA